MKGPQGQSKRQERLALMKQLKTANKKAKKLNDARRAREAAVAKANAIPVAGPGRLDVATRNPGVNVVYDDARALIEKP